jgi:integrase
MATYIQTGSGRVKAIIRRRGHRTTCRTFDRLPQAQSWAAETERRMLNGAHVDLGDAVRLSLRQVIEQYSRRYTGTKKGWQQELHRVNTWLREPMTARPVTAVRSRDIAAWVRDAERRGLAPSTIRNNLQIISQAYRFAQIDLGCEDLRSPTQGVRLPPKREGRDRRLLPGEYERIMAACDRLGLVQLRSVVTFAIETAMRRGELLALTWSDVRPNSVVIRRSKTNRQRAVALSPVALEVLAHARGLDPTFVWPAFAGSSGARVLERQWTRVLRQAGITGLHFHDMRREAVSRLFELGLSAAEVMTISGHSTLAMLSRYTALLVDPLADKLRRLSGAG